jgi:tetratricopeptide (TPR) repeat protein
MRSLVFSPLVALSLLVALEGAALAQTAPAAAAPAPTPAAAPAASPAAAPPASNTGASTPAPKPASGPSPYSELVNKGDGLYVARDFDGAIATYREELAKNSSSAIAHYRLGQALLAKGDTAEAEKSWQNALRFAGNDDTLRLKTQFLLADLRERLKYYDDAISYWKEYASQAQAKTGAVAHPATASERTKRIEEWKKISADSALVKERIKKREDEAVEALKKSSK